LAEAPSTDTVRDSLRVPTILVNLITPATVIGGVTLIQRTVQSQKESTDAQIAAQKTSTDAQIKAIESATAAQKASTDAQIAAINTVADAYRAILTQISTPRASAEKQ
jgi:hypothetical protein